MDELLAEGIPKLAAVGGGGGGLLPLLVELPPRRRPPPRRRRRSRRRKRRMMTWALVSLTKASIMSVRYNVANLFLSGGAL